MAENTRIGLSDLKAPNNKGIAMELSLLVGEMSDFTAANGNPYVKMTLMDGTSKESVNRFKTTVSTLNSGGIAVGTVVDVRMKYDGQFFNIDSIAPTKNTALKAEDFIKHPPIDVEQMYNEIISLIKSSADNFGGKYTPLADLALQILNTYKETYITSSAAVSVHHNLKGGLIYHSYRMVKAADALCNVYTSLDRELMICGAALHDIGKICEYKTFETGEAEFTNDGILYGHLFMGASIIRAFSEKNEFNCNKEKVRLLTHMVLSHHGTQEWGAVACPATAEAFALHYIDCLDAKMYICEENDDMLKPGTITEKKPFGLDNRLYKPDFRE